MFQMMGVFAEFERAMIQERVRARPARAEGKQLGRPKVDATTQQPICQALRRKDRRGILRIVKKLYGSATPAASSADGDEQTGPTADIRDDV